MEEKPNKKRTKIINNTIFFFIILTILVLLFSIIGNFFGWQGTYNNINVVTNALEKQVVSIQNVFDGEGIRYIIGNTVNNFVIFAPLGLIILALIGIGVGHKSGFFSVLFNLLGKHFNKFGLTFLVAIIGIMGSFIGEFSYVLLLPLSAIFFLSNNRNPIIGILVSFVSISAGYGINIIISNLDYILLAYTKTATNLIDQELNINIYGNLFFGIVTTISLAFLITYITEKFMIKKIPKYKKDELIVDNVDINRKEKRGLILAFIGSGLIILIYFYMLIPGLPLSGLLLSNVGNNYFDKLFNSGSYFEQSIICFILFVFSISGLLYGLGAKTIKNKEDVSEALLYGLNNIGNILILLFLASQFISIYNRTNIGSVITAWIIQFIEVLNFSSISLVLLFFIGVGIANLFLVSPATKWAMMSPVIIPLFMKANITPEFTQAVYRISESATNILTPLLPFFVVFIGFVELYNRDDKMIEIKQCYKMLWPYALAITCLWLFIIISWYIIGLPIGINVMPTV